jgi:hypothetical protein
VVERPHVSGRRQPRAHDEAAVARLLDRQHGSQPVTQGADHGGRGTQIFRTSLTATCSRSARKTAILETNYEYIDTERSFLFRHVLRVWCMCEHVRAVCFMMYVRRCMCVSVCACLLNVHAWVVNHMYPLNV